MVNTGLIISSLILMMVTVTCFQLVDGAPYKRVHSSYTYKVKPGEQLIRGNTANIGLWAPSCKELDMSLAQIWVINDRSRTQDHNLEAVEAGWMVQHKLYKDLKPRFFVFYTTDGYKNVNCYDRGGPGCVDCFVVDDNSVYKPGQQIKDVSTIGSPPEKRWNFTIVQDLRSRDWVLFVESTRVGYWRASLFAGDGLLSGATAVQWGGEVVWGPPGVPTNTRMGSGWYFQDSTKWPNKVASFKDVAYLDANLNRASPKKDDLEKIDTGKPYYHISDLQVVAGSTTFYYGGQGPLQKKTPTLLNSSIHPI